MSEGAWKANSGYPYTDQRPQKQYSLGDHIKVRSSSKRNDLIKSGEWKEVMLMRDGWYILEKVN